MSLKKLGRYELSRVLGKGAMGLVYEGRDPNLDRRVAIKTIKVENLSEEAAAEYEARFRIEARSAARLQHPNIVSVYDSDRDGDIAFLVMEFITGEDLKHYLDIGDRYTLEQTLGIMQDLLSALDYAHQQGIVHRDIKPANLLIERSGRVKLTDFGVARIQDSGEATRTQGTMVGTLKYMSPEQVQGRVIDSRADIFAAGIVLYQLLTGMRPFDGATDFAIIQQIVGHTPPSPTAFNSGLPPAIDRVVARSLSKSRDERYGTAREFAAALQAACQDADDTTIVPPLSRQPAGSNGIGTGTGTLRAGEALATTQSGATGGVSTVTQELELVYWKDIKESDDVADLQLFVEKFPSGIYVDLARRRLRKLGVPMEDGSGSRVGLMTVPGQAATLSGTGTPTVVLPRSATSFEPTLRLSPGRAGAPAEPLARVPATDETLPPSGWRPPAAVPAAEAAGASAAVAAPVRPKTPKKDQPDSDDDWYASDKPGISASAARRASGKPAASAAATSLSPRQIAIWTLSAAVLLGTLVFGLQRLKTPARPAASAAALPSMAAAAAPAPALPAASGLVAVALPAPVTIPQPAVITETAAQAAEPAAAAARLAASAALPAATVASAPRAAASSKADIRAARKAVQDKEKADKATLAASATAGPVEVAEPEPKRVVAAAPPAPAPPAPGSPRQACEGRNFLAAELCLAEQCGKRAFSGHAICLERRAMDERRRESEQFRR